MNGKMYVYVSAAFTIYYGEINIWYPWKEQIIDRYCIFCRNPYFLLKQSPTHFQSRDPPSDDPPLT